MHLQKMIHSTRLISLRIDMLWFSEFFNQMYSMLLHFAFFYLHLWENNIPKNAKRLHMQRERTSSLSFCTHVMFKSYNSFLLSIWTRFMIIKWCLGVLQKSFHAQISYLTIMIQKRWWKRETWRENHVSIYKMNPHLNFVWIHKAFEIAPKNLCNVISMTFHCKNVHVFNNMKLKELNPKNNYRNELYNLLTLCSVCYLSIDLYSFY